MVSTRHEHEHLLETRASPDATQTDTAPREGTTRASVAVAVWVALVAVGGGLVYVVLVGPGLKRLDAAPLHAAVSPHVTASTLVPMVIAAIVAIRFRAIVTLPWRTLLGIVWVTGVAWAVSLAAVRGWGRLTAPLDRPGDHLAVLDRIDGLGPFLAGFVDGIRDWPLHVQGHPPGFVVFASAMRWVGLGGGAPIAIVCIVAGAAAAPAALVVVRDVAGEGWARRAAPFVALTPGAIWIATSVDAFYSGVGAAAVALTVLASGRRDRRGTWYALGGGLLFGVTAHLSYGLVLLAAIPVAVAVHRRVVRPLVVAAGGALLVFAGFALAGFLWVDGLAATRDRYDAGIASERPYELFVVANLAIVAFALGPAVAVGLARLRDRRMWVVVGGALVAIALADLSGMSKSEVERIWIPFTPFVLVAAAALVPPTVVLAPAARERGRTLAVGTGWLAVQATLAIVIESLVRTAW